MTVCAPDARLDPSLRRTWNEVTTVKKLTKVKTFRATALQRWGGCHSARNEESLIVPSAMYEMIDQRCFTSLKMTGMMLQPIDALTSQFCPA